VLYFKEERRLFVLFQAAGRCFTLKKKVNSLFFFKQPIRFFAQIHAVSEILFFPSQVTETGWGEFEIVIKIYFQDQRQVTLFSTSILDKFF
jgi:hypothetical protein